MDNQKREILGYVFGGLGLFVTLYLLYMGFFYQWMLFFQSILYIIIFVVLIAASIGSLLIAFLYGNQELQSWLYSLLSFHILAFSWVTFTFIYGLFQAIVWIGIWIVPISLSYVLLIKGVKTGKNTRPVAKILKIFPVLFTSIFIIFFLVNHHLRTM